MKLTMKLCGDPLRAGNTNKIVRHYFTFST